jgi:hypothetical protein
VETPYLSDVFQPELIHPEHSVVSCSLMLLVDVGFSLWGRGLVRERAEGCKRSVTGPFGHLKCPLLGRIR